MQNIFYIKNIDKSFVGKTIFIFSLLSYFFLKLPFNCSVICSSANEGFYYIYAQNLLDSLKYDTFCGPLFVFLYAFILKVFGFGTASIISTHFLQTFVILLTAIFSFVLAKELINDFFAGVAVLSFILLQITPIGLWGGGLELESAFAFEAEVLCSFFSLCSIICFLMSSKKQTPFMYCFFSGILAFLSFASKANGLVLTIAFLCWAIYLLLFQKTYLIDIKQHLLFFFTGWLLCFLAFDLVMFMLKTNPLTFWRNCFWVGSYKAITTKTYFDLLKLIFHFMTRGSTSLNNFILFLTSFLSFLWICLRGYLLKLKDDPRQHFWILIAIWYLGNACAIIVPGVYSSYYYNLIWPSIALLLVLALKDIFYYFADLKIQLIVSILVSGLFICRLITISPTYYKLARANIMMNAFSQPLSFKDPILPEEIISSKNRFLGLQVADIINSKLPDKRDRFYVFNFFKGFASFSPNIYIYAKRPCFTTILSDHLIQSHVHNYAKEKLIKILINSPPKLILVSKQPYVDENMVKRLDLFLVWLRDFLSQKYHLETTFNFNNGKKDEVCYIYERN